MKKRQLITILILLAFAIPAFCQYGGDSLGNHKAKKNLNMQENDIINAGTVRANNFDGNFSTGVPHIIECKAGENLTKGDVVYRSGVVGSKMQVSKADFDDPDKDDAIGFAFQTATNGQDILIIMNGMLEDINTTGRAAGSIYLWETGDYTGSAPSSGVVQELGQLNRVHVSLGSIYVHVHPVDDYISAGIYRDVDIRMGDQGGRIVFEDGQDNHIGHMTAGSTTLKAVGTNVNSHEFILEADDGGVKEIAKLQVIQGADPYLRVSVTDDNGSPATVNVIDIHDTVLSFVNDNACDIGATGANRPKDYYGAGSIIIAGTIDTNGTPTEVFSMNQDVQNTDSVTFGAQTITLHAGVNSLSVATTSHFLNDITCDTTVYAEVGNFSQLLGHSPIDVRSPMILHSSTTFENDVWVNTLRTFYTSLIQAPNTGGIQIFDTNGTNGWRIQGITGNLEAIVGSETVDGRDVATDGTELDTITAGDNLTATYGVIGATLNITGRGDFGGDVHADALYDASGQVVTGNKETEINLEAEQFSRPGTSNASIYTQQGEVSYEGVSSTYSRITLKLPDSADPNFGYASMNWSRQWDDGTVYLYVTFVTSGTSDGNANITVGISSCPGTSDNWEVYDSTTNVGDSWCEQKIATMTITSTNVLVDGRHITVHVGRRNEDTSTQTIYVLNTKFVYTKD